MEVRDTPDFANRRTIGVTEPTRHGRLAEVGAVCWRDTVEFKVRGRQPEAVGKARCLGVHDNVFGRGVQEPLQRCIVAGDELLERVVADNKDGETWAPAADATGALAE